MIPGRRTAPDRGPGYQPYFSSTAIPLTSLPADAPTGAAILVRAWRRTLEDIERAAPCAFPLRRWGSIHCRRIAEKSDNVIASQKIGRSQQWIRPGHGTRIMVRACPGLCALDHMRNLPGTARSLLFQLHPHGVGAVSDRPDGRSQLGERTAEQIAPVAHLIVLSETNNGAVKSRM